MKSIRQRSIGVILLLASALHGVAIEALQVSVQCSNVVLSWPSAEHETYIVQYRPTLDPEIPWQTLTSSLPAEVGTNVTVFVHSNVVTQPSCGGEALLAMMSDEPVKRYDPVDDAIRLNVSLAMRADGRFR